MTKIVIIGAGPMGLYLAFKLKKAGLKNIVVYDPRAGEYVRPGHINTDIFHVLEDKIGEKFWTNKTGHIKDFERILFERVSKLNIPIEKKSFVRFNNDPNHKGVILSDRDNNKEFVECDYAFDCTGSKRKLIHEVNKLSIQPVFTLNQISNEINVKNHFLAYVKMTKEDLRAINNEDNYSTANQIPPYQYAQSIERLRQFGWQEFGFPKCYGMDFTKGKVCLYMECPDNLPQASYEPWVQAVVDAVTNTKQIVFQRLPSSSKNLKKPRFNSFEVVPMELNQVAYQGKGLPMVVAIGDAQIDPNYVLAHGVLDGLDRVDRMIKKMVILNGGIGYFDADEYLTSLKTMLSKHRNNITSHYQDRAFYFNRWLHKAETMYESAVATAVSNEEIVQFQTTLIEIKARIHYKKAIRKFNECHGGTGSVVYTKTNLNDLFASFTEIDDSLVQAIVNFTAAFSSQRNDALEKLTAMAKLWKDLGNQYFKAAQFYQAIECYKNSLLAYRNLPIPNQWDVEILALQSNLLISYRKCNQHLRVMKEGQDILSQFPDSPKLNPTKTKILFNLIKAFEDAIKMQIDSNKTILFDNVKGLCAKYEHLMSAELKVELDSLTQQIQTAMPKPIPITQTGSSFFPMPQGQNQNTEGASFYSNGFM